MFQILIQIQETIDKYGQTAQTTCYVTTGVRIVPGFFFLLFKLLLPHRVNSVSFSCFNFYCDCIKNLPVITFIKKHLSKPIFFIGQSTTNEFKTLLLTEEAHVRIKPENSSTPPNEASRKNIQSSHKASCKYYYK